VRSKADDMASLV